LLVVTDTRQIGTNLDKTNELKSRVYTVIDVIYLIINLNTFEDKIEHEEKALPYRLCQW
jgi:Fe-S-cluster formation regulator IscX/YfhJ